MVAALLVTAVSCKKAESTVEQDGTVALHFTVATDMATKASSDFGTGSNVDELYVQVYRVVNETTFTKTNAQPTIVKVKNGEWDVDMRLAKSYKYRIAFWAQQSGNGIYDVANLNAVSVDYEAIAINSDKADAFCAARVLEVNGAISETVQLYRPLAQFNLGTNDLTEYMNSLVDGDDTSLKVAIAMTDVPNVINVLGGEADAEGKVAATTSGEVDVNFPAVAVLNVDDKIDANGINYEYMSMVYVLADKAKEVTDFTATITNTTQTVNTVAVTSVPYQANYRTNIVGQLLCGSLHYDVIIVPEFYTPDYVVVSNTQEISEGLVYNFDEMRYYVSNNTGFQTALTSTVPDGSTVVLADGTYVGNTNDSPEHPSPWARVTKNLTIKAATEGQVVIDGCMTIEGAGKVLTVEGVVFRNDAKAPIYNPSSGAGHVTNHKEKYASINTYGGSVNAKNCTFQATTDEAQIWYYSSTGDRMILENCTFERAEGFTGNHRPIQAKPNFTVTGCTFKNVERYVVQLYGNGTEASKCVVTNNKIDPVPTSGEYAVVQPLSIGSSNGAVNNTEFTVFGNTDLTGGAVSWKYATKNMTLVGTGLTYTDEVITWEVQNDLKI